MFEGRGNDSACCLGNKIRNIFQSISSCCIYNNWPIISFVFNKHSYKLFIVHGWLSDISSEAGERKPHRNNIILSLYCAFTPDKCIFVCWLCSNYLWGPAIAYFFTISIKLLYFQNSWNFKFVYWKNSFHNQKAHEKL